MCIILIINLSLPMFIFALPKWYYYIMSYSLTIYTLPIYIPPLYATLHQIWCRDGLVNGVLLLCNDNIVSSNLCEMSSL